MCPKVLYSCKGRVAHLTELPCKERNTIGYKSHDDYVIQANQLVKGNAASPGTQTWEKKITTHFYIGSNNDNNDLK